MLKKIIYLILLIFIFGCEQKIAEKEVHNGIHKDSLSKSIKSNKKQSDIVASTQQHQKENSVISKNGLARLKQKNMNRDQKSKNDTIYTDSCYCITTGLEEVNHMACFDYNDTLRSLVKETRKSIIIKDSFNQKGVKVLHIQVNDTLFKKW